MKKLSPLIEAQLVDYLDGNLNAKSKMDIETELSKSEAARHRLHELKLLDNSLRKANLEMPSRNFTQKVMQALDALPATGNISPRNGLLLFLGVIIAIGISLLLVSSGVFDRVNAPISFESIKIAKRITDQPLPSFNINGKFVFKIIIALTMALSFLLLDRTVLKPYFNAKAKMHF